MERAKKYWWLHIALLLCLFLCMMAVMRSAAANVARLSGGQGITDLTFGISPEKVRAALTRYNADSASYYRYIFYSIDFVYALVYGSFYRCAVRAFYTRAGAGKRTVRVMAFLPVIGVTADLLENTVMFILLGENEISGLLCALFTAFNIIKFVFVYSSLTAAVGGLVWLIKKRLW